MQSVRKKRGVPGGFPHLNFSLFIALVLSIAFLAQSEANTINLTAGNSYKADLDVDTASSRWAGIKVTNNAVDLTESSSSFASLTLDTANINENSFPGANFKDGQHYYVAMLGSTFDGANILNVSVLDLFNEQLFDSTQFSAFYPNYDSYNDNPQETFCCSTAQVPIGGVNYTAFEITLTNSISYYLLKYNNSGTATPLFLVEIEDKTCYNSTACVGEFMLPINSNPYYFYALSKIPAYDIIIYIDSALTTAFSQTALPYNVTLEVRNLYTGLALPNMSVAIGETQGQNIFVPIRLSGYVSTAYSTGLTDDGGRESFLMAPTVYPTVSNYSIWAAVVEYGVFVTTETLSVTQKDSLARQSKPLSNTPLMDNSKIAVNSMNQIVSTLFKWASEREEAKEFTITYDITLDTFTILDHVTAGSTLTLKTAAPNVIHTALTNNGIPMSGSGYSVKVQEADGYLIVNPYTGSNPLSQKDRYHYQTIAIGTDFIITPTAVGAVASNVTLNILDSGNNVLNMQVAAVDSTLNIVTGGNNYPNDVLKAVVNSVNAVVYSLFYSLNY
ncbi:MAG: hypothetical protein ABIC95_03110 [archaeon]